MCKFISIFILLLAICGLNADMIYENRFDNPDNLKGWTGKTQIEDNSLMFSPLKRTKGLSYASKVLDPAALKGKIIRLSCEVKGDNVLDSNAKAPHHGCKVQLVLKSDGKSSWIDIPFPAGNFGWKVYAKVFAVAPNVDSAMLNIGFQNSGGTFQVRNLTLEAVGDVVDFATKANMGILDDIAGNGKGGWTDQGPNQDGRPLLEGLQSTDFNGIPMFIKTIGNGMFVMNFEKFPGGPKSVTIPVNTEQVKSLYFMHALAWAPKEKEEIGLITVIGENGKQQVFPVISKQDVGEWYYSVIPEVNAFPAVMSKLPNKVPIGVYISKFSFPANFGKVTGITFETNKNSIWMILGASLTKLDLPLPRRKPFVIKPDKQWLPIAGDYRMPVKTNSALDLSSYMSREKVGEAGRVIINRKGHFAFEKRPDKAVRFLAYALCPKEDEDFENHAAVKRLVREIRKSGYNMLRTHFLDSALMKKAKHDFEFDPKMLDLFDYLIFCMKENGIYLNLDLMTSWIGFSAGNVYSKENKDPRNAFKARIHFEAEIREHWRKGVEKLLCRVNKYTKTRLIDDPVLVMAVGYNEQEYGFWRPFAKQHILPAWRQFLTQRYGTIDQLKQAWGKKAEKISAFEEIPCFSLPKRVYENDDVALFLRDVETNTLRWYEKTMKKMGYPGLVTGYNCGKNQYYNMLRKDSPFIAMNAYHAHPSDWIRKGSVISQKSAIEEKAKLFRDFLSVKQVGKPLVVTEHNLAFWNKYRYEQAFVVGAYAAFQGFDSLTCFGAPVSFRKEKRILTFYNYMDPIAKASEFLTFFLYVRGDIQPANPGLRVIVKEEDVFKTNGLRGGLSTELSLPALMTGVSLECIGQGEVSKKLTPRESPINLTETSSVMVSDSGFSKTLDRPDASADKIINLLKHKKVLQTSNRSNGRNLFESSTGEIFMNSDKKFMQINTPRFQGICAEAGTQATMNDFAVERMTKNGTLALVSIDGMKNIQNADRLMLVYATNALNNGMKFTGPDMITLQYVGNLPVLLEQGAFTVIVKNKNAGKLKLYPLDLNGDRLKEISPVKVDENLATFHVNTSNDGAAVFFEIN